MPICYGEVDCGGTRALLLSEVGGHSLNARNATEIEANVVRLQAVQSRHSGRVVFLSCGMIGPPEGLLLKEGAACHAHGFD
jgi:hypothetical protein